MPDFKIINSDCVKAMKEMPDNSVDAIVTDPPYGLEFMGKEWDSFAKGGGTGWKAGQLSDTQALPEGNVFKEKGFGQMPIFRGMTNEQRQTFYDFSFSWATEAFRVLKPGGHLISFAGSRTYHRMACAIEDAGFEVRDQIMWVYGSGFPKSLNVSKAFDKDNGAERTVVGKAKHSQPAKSGHHGGMTGESIVGGGERFTPDVTVATSDEAKAWDGWGTALKPAHEPMVLARKPLEGTVVENIRKWGVGGLNIDGCRVGYQSESDKEQAHYNALGMERLKMEDGEKLGSFEGGWKKHKPTLPQGRFPANFIHDGSQQVLDLFPSEAGAAAPVKKGYSGEAKNGIYHDYAQRGDDGETFYGDKGSAARFFYCAKASKKDRDDGCDELPTKEKAAHMRTADGTGDASMTDGFQPTQRKNIHPTVKPTELMRYLVRLVTPKGGLVLDPFNGSGSTGRAAMLEGMNYVGIEMNEEYAKIAEARIRAAQARSGEQAV